MQNSTTKSEHDPFLEIKNRIFVLSNGFYFTPFTLEYGYKIIDSILPKIQDALYDVYISQIEALIHEINEIEKDKDGILNNIREDDYKFVFRNDDDKNVIVTDTIKELSFYEAELQKISDELLNRQEKYITIPPLKPFKTNLKVPELAYLFRALVDEGLITIPKGDGALFIRRLTELFVSKSTKVEANSSKQMNAFYTQVEPDAAKEWSFRFLNLSTRAKKDSK